MDYTPKRFGPMEKIPNLIGKDPKSTAKNMEESMRDLYKNIWDRGDDMYNHGTWTIHTNIPETFIAKISSPKLKSMILLYNSHPCKKRMMIWHNNHSDLHFYCDAEVFKKTIDSIENELSECSKYCCMDGYMESSITLEEKLELLEAMIPCNPYTDNGWHLDGSNEYSSCFDYPISSTALQPCYTEPAQEETFREKTKFNLQEFNLQVFQLIRRGILQPRACL